VRQFDIIENLNPVTRTRFPFAVILQHDRVSTFSALVVAPLTDASSPLLGTRLHPSIEVGGRQMVILIEELSAVHRRTLGRVVGSAETNRYAVVAAIDLLFTGI
jgi:toxin CcdB